MTSTRALPRWLARLAFVSLVAPVSAVVLAPPARAGETGTLRYDVPGTYEWVVPGGVDTIQVDLYGAQGGAHSSGVTVPGGLGGHAAGVLHVTPGQHVAVVVGGPGGDATRVPYGVQPGGTGGFNGGGAGGNGEWPGGGGGGATELRLYFYQGANGVCRSSSPRAPPARR